ncbi:hypothetical protein RD792_002318 [Penstemon davidsonii]|uniref:F-box domain-containing protein n=1 Tax=Penstemon davidsonii TaxID=160366 RepID=A0ABR0DQS4_9LAMI|nr:hypothetical protein RD792_002318 [Penstemon davidsonii]
MEIPTAVPPSSAPPPPWIELPGDVTANILHRLGAVEILESAQRVCTTWWSVCQDPSLWQVIDMKNIGDIYEMTSDLNIICRQAVDRSQGQLIDFNMEYFGTDELLHYVSERSTNLRRLRLACCYEISGKGLSESVKKFPQLEDLHLFFMPSIHGEDIEAIGRSCPMLKSFTFNERAYRYPLIEEDIALAVAESMPGLHQLQLFGNRMTNDGLQAILDGCPNLKLLDLRQCFNVDQWKICSNQIKDLKLPYDSVHDYEWDAEICNCESFIDAVHSSEFSDVDPYGGADDKSVSFASLGIS